VGAPDQMTVSQHSGQGGSHREKSGKISPKNGLIKKKFFQTFHISAELTKKRYNFKIGAKKIIILVYLSTFKEKKNYSEYR
jgi:hypothetical protein